MSKSDLCYNFYIILIICLVGWCGKIAIPSK